VNYVEFGATKYDGLALARESLLVDVFGEFYNFLFNIWHYSTGSRADDVMIGNFERNEYNWNGKGHKVGDIIDLGDYCVLLLLDEIVRGSPHTEWTNDEFTRSKQNREANHAANLRTKNFKKKLFI
jgi:hypothetical protein